MPRIPSPDDLSAPRLDNARNPAQIDERTAYDIGRAGKAWGNAIEHVGAAFGEVMGKVGEAEDASLASKAKLEWMTYSNKTWNDLSQNAKEDGSGWDQTVPTFKQGYEDFKARYVDRISDPNKKRELDFYLQNDVAKHGFAGARNYQSGKASMYDRDLSANIEGAAQRLSEAPSQEAYDQLRANLSEYADSGRGYYMDQAKVDARKREIEGKLMMGLYNGLIKKDPEAAAELLGKIRAGGYEIDERPAGSNVVPIRPQSQAPSGRIVDRTDSGLRTMGGIRPEGIVFHHTAGSSADGAISALKNRGLSYNYLIDRDGSVIELVPSDKGALHMRPSDKGSSLSNQNSIGISFVGRNDDDVTDAQRQAGRTLAGQLAERYGIKQQNVFGHGEVNSHKEHNEGARDARFIRENGFLAMAADAAPKPSAPDAAPLGARTLTQYAEMSDAERSRIKDTLAGVGIAHQEADGRIVIDRASAAKAEPQVASYIARAQEIAKTDPDRPVSDLLSPEDLKLAQANAPEGVDVSKLTAAQAAELGERLIRNGTGKPSQEWPQGRLKGGQVFEVDTKQGRLRIPSEAVNSIDRRMLQQLDRDTREAVIIRQREGEALAARQMEMQLLNVERTGRDHPDYNAATIADVYRKNPKKVQEFNRRLEVAQGVHNAIGDMANMHGDQIDARLVDLQAKVVDADGVADPEAAKIVERAERRVKVMMDRRIKDPAAAVRDSREVQAILKELPGGEPRDKAHVFQIADATIRAQVRLGLPPMPVTRQQADFIIAPIKYAPEKERRAVADAIIKKLSDDYGPHAKLALEGALALSHMDKQEDRDAVKSAFARANRPLAPPEPPSWWEQRSWPSLEQQRRAVESSKSPPVNSGDNRPPATNRSRYPDNFFQRVQ